MEFFQKRRKQADPERPGNSKSGGRGKADITAEVRKITGVIPVTQMPECIEQPANGEFKSRAKQRGKEKNVPEKFLPKLHEKGKQDSTNPIDREPWTI